MSDFFLIPVRPTIRYKESKELILNEFTKLPRDVRKYLHSFVIYEIHFIEPCWDCLSKPAWKREHDCLFKPIPLGTPHIDHRKYTENSFAFYKARRTVLNLIDQPFDTVMFPIPKSVKHFELYLIREGCISRGKPNYIIYAKSS